MKDPKVILHNLIYARYCTIHAKYKHTQQKSEKTNHQYTISCFMKKLIYKRKRKLDLAVHYGNPELACHIAYTPA